MSTDRKRWGWGLLLSARRIRAGRRLSVARARQRKAGTSRSRADRSGRPGALGDAPTVHSPASTSVPGAYDDAVARWERGRGTDGRAVADAPLLRGPAPACRTGRSRGYRRGRASRTAAAWATPDRRLRATCVAGGLLHLHHLTPLHDAAATSCRGVPIVTHLHGTELKMLDGIARERAGGRPGPHARWWASRLGEGGAPRATATIAISPHERGRGRAPARARPGDRALARRRRRRRALRARAARATTSGARAGSVARRDPHGWDEATGSPGASATARQVLDAFFDPDRRPRPVLLFVGRFLGFKRVPLLVRAYARARERMTVPAPLVIWGGVPGRVGGRAPPHRRRTRGRRAACSSPAGAATRNCRRTRLRRLLRRALHRRAVRPGVPGGDGLRAAGDRHAQRRAAELRQGVGISIRHGMRSWCFHRSAEPS